MRVIGIDPAPSKDSTVFDGEFHQLDPTALARYLDRVRAEGPALLCWDAPLIGPADPDVPVFSPAALSQRPAERFFTQGKFGYKTPKGVSVLPYGGCPHWTSSRALLGLPRVGPFDAPWSELPFHPVFEPPAPVGHFIAEVHPAVAIWLWCRDEPGGATQSWVYKEEQDVFQRLWTVLHDRLRSFSSTSIQSHLHVQPADDDQLDAFVAFALGVLWLETIDVVTFLGDADIGGFLLPQTPKLVADFTQFREHHCTPVLEKSL